MKKFYKSITYSKYDFRRRKNVRKVREDIKNVFTLGLLLIAIIVAVTLHHFVPMSPIQTQQSQTGTESRKDIHRLSRIAFRFQRRKRIGKVLAVA